jgi:Flp pilus assembly protein TadG
MPSEHREPTEHSDRRAVLAGFLRARTGLKERGAEAVEFALVVPFVLLMLGGVIDFGYMINRDTMINNASREGAREGSYNLNLNAVKCKVRQSLTSIEAVGVGADCTPSPTTITVTVTCRRVGGTACTSFPGTAGVDAASGGTVVVKVDYVHTWLTPAGQNATLSYKPTITLSKTTEMRIE